MSPSKTGIKITPIAEPILHAEGPQWCQTEQSLLFVDTFNATVYRWNHDSKKISSYKLENHDSVGVILPVDNETNQYIVCADRDLYKFKWTDEQTYLEHLNRVDKEKPYNQFNDGKADKNGRLWIGTLTRNKDLTVAANGGSLFSITGKRLDTVEEKITETSISNGLDWSHDNKKFYFIDSVNRTVDEYEYQAVSGNIGDQKVIFNLKHYPDLHGIPDGMVIDNEGNLWIALFGGSHVLNIDPNSGKLIQAVKIPASYVTSVCFGGPDLDVLFVTTSRLHLNEEQRKLEPFAGSVFTVERIGVRGTLINPVKL